MCCVFALRSVLNVSCVYAVNNRIASFACSLFQFLLFLACRRLVYGFRGEATAAPRRQHAEDFGVRPRGDANDKHTADVFQKEEAWRRGKGGSGFT